MILAILAALTPSLSHAQAATSAPKIYSCRDSTGKILRSDRLPPGCVELKEMNTDGSTRGDVPPSLSPAENAERFECERRNAELRSEQRDLVRRDQVLVTKFPNEARHKKAREDALDDVRRSVRQSEERIGQLLKDRKPLLDEAEFYKRKELPPMLKQQLDSNDALLGAQKQLSQNQQGEMVRINRVFDDQLVQLRKLWAGGLAAPAKYLDCSAAAIRKER
ncbi:MAG: hypothetical protein ABI143_00780 [Caldimonas sp.]